MDLILAPSAFYFDWIAHQFIGFSFYYFIRRNRLHFGFCALISSYFTYSSIVTGSVLTQFKFYSILPIHINYTCVVISDCINRSKIRFKTLLIYLCITEAHDMQRKRVIIDI